MTWSAKGYAAFEDERTRPVRDLLSAVPDRGVHNAIDLGCGPGNSTQVLAARFPGAALRGIDSSPDMIAAARTRLPGLRFDILEIERWIGTPRSDDPESWDLILANACSGCRITEVSFPRSLRGSRAGGASPSRCRTISTNRPIG
jgi:trans-aconitate 2-methyltransferase